MTDTIGKRVYPDETLMILEEPGMYGLDRQNIWWARVPAPGFPMAALSDHLVVENADGTITVTPSILIEGQHGKVWHGYLKNSVWSEV